MPKSQYVDPGKAFESGYIHFEDIPVCQYNKTLAEEKKMVNTPEWIEKYARSEMGYAAPDEIVFIDSTVSN